MKINYIKTKNEYINFIPLNYKKSFNRKITNGDLQNMLNEYIEYLKKNGVSDEEIRRMDLKIYFT
ncbi:hypothetical protein N5T90_09145 [Aliarcobacter cryaerophilus]|uniref:hypothetical protein n=1 Tax=Aliarcobacter cryaerophilus TaxID=28198 RepID=UPI0021B184AD|nr:hypothetical protein [Aliarcobacter cryaerophilus]MCT7471041.1 hypothetical protein [Aliarcobacter cryaerophilus]MCT7522932.1 hypothetical protein [Aliarcobacter cryaerophilus]